MQNMENDESQINPKPSGKQSFWILVFIATSMALISWQKWPDLTIDYGVQLYIPWQLAQGKVLYKDIVHIHGPASVYFHALIFKVFGPGILILSGLNFLIIACLTTLIYRIFFKTGNHLSALITSLTFLTTFAFSQYVVTGNYNFVNPYSNESTHGIFLSFLVIYQLTKYLERHRMADIGIMGGITGLIFLTKIEVFFAEFISVLFCLSIALKKERLPRGVLFQKFALFTGACMIFPLLFLLYFSLHMPWVEAFTSIISPWINTTNESARELLFYQWVMGIDDPAHNLFRMALFTILLIAGATLLLFINHLLKNNPKYAWPLSALVALVISGSVIYYDLPWMELSRPLPLFMVILGIYLIVEMKNDNALHPKKLTFLCLTLFSFLLMLKMILNVHVYHYGFTLVLPATLIFIKVVLDELPEFSNKISHSSAFIKPVGLTLVLLYSLPHFWVSYNYYQKKTFPVGEGLDTIYTYNPYFEERGPIVRVALDFIKKNMGPDTTFSAFPDSVIFNYLLRRENPVKFINFGPGEWKLFGDKQVLESIQQNSPTYILITERNFEEFGYKTFGKDYGQTLYSWIMKNYATVKLVGKDPFDEAGFGIRIMEKYSNPSF